MEAAANLQQEFYGGIAGEVGGFKLFIKRYAEAVRERAGIAYTEYREDSGN